ncbi:unnamed protein product [Discosporangium mesarthrocarpum]
MPEGEGIAFSSGMSEGGKEQIPNKIIGRGLVEEVPLLTEEDACRLLAACETRVLQALEAILGAGAGTGEGSGWSDHSFWHSGLNNRGMPLGRDGVTEGPATPSTLQRLFTGRTKGLEGDGIGMDVRVSPLKARDIRFERSMGEAVRQEDELLEMQEAEENNFDRRAMAAGVASFLEEALDTKQANGHLRRANMLVMGKQGKRAGFGLVMDDVLAGADIDIYGIADEKRRANAPGSGLQGSARGRTAALTKADLAGAVHARPDFKASAQVTLARRKHVERKRAMLKKKAERATH